MKRILLLVPVFLSLLCCKETEEIKLDYSPIQLETKPVSDIGYDYVTFNGGITRLNNEKIVDIGFILFESTDRGAKQIEISVGAKAAKEGNVSFQYKSPQRFIEMAPYRYCFYVKTENAFYKGELVNFQVDNLKIEQTGLLSVELGDTILVRGDFTQIKDDYIITLDSKELRHTLSHDNKTLSVILPESGYTHGRLADVVLQWNDRQPYRYQRQLSSVRFVATLNEPSKTSYSILESITLTGKGLPYSWSEDLYIFLGGQRLIYNGGFSLAYFDNLEGNTFEWGYYNGKDSVFFKKPLTIVPPSGDVISFSQPVIHPKQISTLNGVSRYRYFNNKMGKLELGQYPAVDLLPSSETIYFRVDNIPEGRYPLTIHNPYFPFTTKETIEVRNFKWSATDRETGYYDEIVRVTGSFIANQVYAVMFEGTKQHELYANASDGQLAFNIPVLPPGDYKVKVGYTNAFEGNINYTSTEKNLTILKPVIEEVSPRSGYAGDLVTIRGKGLKKMTQLLIGTYWTYPIFRDNGDIQFMLPNYIPTGNMAIEADFTDFKVSAPYSFIMK